MIRALLSDKIGSRHGYFWFVALPRVGELVALGDDTICPVEAVIHIPADGGLHEKPSHKEPAKCSVRVLIGRPISDPPRIS